MKATKKLLMIGLMLLVLTGLTVFFSISASAAWPTDLTTANIVNDVKFEDKIFNGNTDGAVFDAEATKAAIQESVGTTITIDSVTLTGTPVYGASNVNDAQDVLLNGTTLTVNYTDGGVADVATFTFTTVHKARGAIKAAKISIDRYELVDGRVYDGTANAYLAKVYYTVEGVVGTQNAVYDATNKKFVLVGFAGDEIPLNIVTALYESKNVNRELGGYVGTRLVSIDADIKTEDWRNYYFENVDLSFQSAINPAPVKVTVNGVLTKEYGSAEPNDFTDLDYFGFVTGETPVINGAPARVAGEDAGTYAITLGTLAMSDNDPFFADNYVLSIDTNTDEFVITPQKITIAAIDNATKIYDGNAISCTAEPIEGITVTITSNGTDVNKYYKANLTVTASGAGAANYEFSVADDLYLEITKKTLTVDYTGSAVYNSELQAFTFSFDTGVSTHKATITLTTAKAIAGTYDATGVTAAGFAIDPAAMSGNYDYKLGTIAITITPAEISFTVNATPTYTGSNITVTDGITATGLQGADKVTVTITTNGKLVGDYNTLGKYTPNFTVKDGDEDVTASYKVVEGSVAIKIVPKPITVKVGTSKVFDGTALESVVGDMSAALVTGDKFDAGKFQTNSRNVGTYTVQGTAATEWAISEAVKIVDGDGADVTACYALTYDVTLEITKKPLEVIVNASKVYNGTALEVVVNMAADGIISFGTDKGLADGDKLTLGAFTTVGQNAGVYTVQGTEWKVAGLASDYGIGNYDVTYNVTLTINKNKITITGVNGIADMIYNGGVDLPTWGEITYKLEAVLDYGTPSPVVKATDVNWSNKNAGTNTVVLVDPIVTGAGVIADNFEIVYAGEAVAASGKITKATVTVTDVINVFSKYYDGNTSMTAVDGKSIVINYTLNTTLVDGAAAPVLSGNIGWSNKNAGTTTANLANVVVDDPTNFTVATTWNNVPTDAKILKIVLTPYLASVDGKTYDGNAATQKAVLGYDYTEGAAVAGETPEFTTDYVAKWVSVMAGTKLIDVTGIALKAEWLTNYELSVTALDDVTARDNDPTDVISVRTIIITATANKVYDKTTLSVAYDKFLADNLVNGIDGAIDGFTAGVFTTTGVNAGMYETKDTEWTISTAIVITATTPHADSAADPIDRTSCYDIKFVDASDKSTVELEIKTRPIQIVSNEKHIIYGDARPVYTWTIKNTVDAEDLNKLLAKFDTNDIILDCNYAPGSAVGAYTVKFIKKVDDARLSEIVKAAGLNYEYDNYEFTTPAYVENDVNVYKKDLALFIENLKVMYSQNAPAVEGYKVLGSTATYALPFDGTHYTVYKADGTAVKLLPAELESTANRPLGFVAGDNFSNVIGYAEFKLTTTYGAGSGVGQGDLANGAYSVTSTTALSALKADNYTVVAYSATEDIGHGEITVTPYVLTVTPAAIGKLYGETDPEIIPAGGIIAHLQAQLPYANQTLTTVATPTLVRATGEEVGDYAFTLSIELLTSVTGGITFNANNYVVELAKDPNGNNVVFTIGADKVTISGVVGTNKIYDGTVNALDALDLTGIVVKDSHGNVITVNVLVEATFADKNVGNGKVVTLKFTLDHTDPTAKFYIVDEANCQATTTANVTPKQLTVTGIKAQDKIYDGTRTATLDLSNLTLEGLVIGDNVGFNYIVAYFESAKANDVAKIVFDSPYLTGADKNNYVLTVAPISAKIAPKTIYLTSAVISNKTYDATTALVNPTVLSFAFNNDVVGDDDVAIKLADAYTLAYASKDVFAGVQNLTGVDVADFVLYGADADNYILAISATNSITSSIEKATIIINSAVVSDKVYDGNANLATGATITVVADGVYAGDTVLYAIAGGNDIAYATINVAGVQELNNFTADDVVLEGADAGNYKVAVAADCTVTSSITPRGITISGITAKNKDYDGTDKNIEFIYDNVTTDFLVVVGGVEDIVNVNVKSYNVVNGGNAGHTAIEIELEIDNSNYFINVGSQTQCEIDIYKINVTITVNDQTITYGEAADFAVDAWSSQVVTGSGFVAVTPSTWVAENLFVDYKLITEYVNEAGNANRVVGSYLFTIEYVDAAEAERVATNYNVTIEAAEIIVEKRVLTVTPDNAAIIYGNAFTTDDITVALSNWAYGEDATTVVINGEYVITTTYENVAGSANRVVGTYGYDLTASTLEADNYSFDYTATADVTVAKRTVTVSVDPTVITYGDAVPTYVIKFVNWVYDEGTATGSDLISHDSWLGVSVSNAYEQGNDAGAYPYTFNGAYYALQNYEFDYQPGELTVNKRQITVTANDMALIYGESIDTTKYGYTFTGEFYGEDVIGEVTFACDYVAGNNIGTYAIVPSIADTTNYDYTCVNGTLTVSPKSITLTVKDHTIEYRADAANAGFDGLDQILAKDVDSFAFNFTYGDYAVGSPVGAYTITLNYTANANYTVSAESKLTATLTVAARKITVTPAHGNLVYGAAIPADGYTYDWNHKDMLATDSVTFGGTAAYATTYTKGATAKNTYVITVSGLTLEGDKAANYEIVYAEGTQTVVKAALTINIAGEIFYGSDLPTDYTVTGTGFVLGETLENLGGELAITVPSYTKGNDVGSYAIVASGYTSDNYEITYNAANVLTVKKVVINGVVDTPANIVYGDAEPTFTVTFDWSTLVNGDSKDALKGFVVGTITSTYDVADAANRIIGTYPITAAGYEATNYEFVITGATLKVDPKPITLNAKDYTGSVIYGSEFPIADIDDTYVEILTGALVYGETFATSDIVFSFKTDYIAGNDTDVYTYVASATSTNYAITWNNNNGEFTVSPKTLNFTIDATTNVIYGNQPDYSGVINWNEADFFIGDTAEDLVGSITVRATGYGAGSPVGTYPITVKINLADDGNYVVCYNGVTYADAFEDNTIATLVVLKRNIHISANDAETEYYSAAPKFGYTVAGSGIAANDTLAGVFGQIKFTCTYGAGASVGDYTIVITTEKTSDNYELVLENGTLKVTPKTIYIMPDADSKFAGAADPSFTFTYSGNIAGETPKFTGKLTRVEGETAGLYSFECDELGLADNAPFYAENYKLAIDPNAPQFEIFGADSENAINIKLEGAGVDLLDEIHLYYVFSITNPNGLEIAEMGLLQWTAGEYAALTSYDYDAKYAFTNGYADGGYYFYNGQSIDATKYMDTYYARAYVKLANGEYVYSKVMSYSVTDYAKTILSSEAAEHVEARSVVIAMLDYGTAVMKFRGMTGAGYPSDIVSASNRTEYGKVYEDTLKVPTIKPDKTVDETKLSDRLSFYGISTTLYGAIDVNFNSNIVELAEGETVGMYYWTAEQYAAATGNLDVSVATYIECTREASQYTASIKNIAAKDADDVYYAVLVIRDAEGNDVEYSRTVAGSAAIYASIAVDYFNGQSVEAVAKAMLVYINEAAKYAAN